MRILITGGAGFIGSHLVDRLMERGDSVLVIDNFSTGRRDSLKSHPRLEVVEGSIVDDALVGRSFERFSPEIVVHAAASYKDPDNWEEDIRTNVLGTTIVARASQKHGAKRLIYFQTALCYGLHPLEQPITLNHPIRPEGSSYAYSKTAGEQYIQLSGLEYVTFRLANAYGPRNITGPLPTFFQRLSTNKPCFVMDTRRDFIFVDDVVACVLLALDGKGKGPYHISSGGDVSIKQLFDATIAALGMRLDREVEVRPRAPDDVATILLDPSKTARDFGWKAKTELEAGVRAAIEYYQKFGIGETFTHLRPMDAKGGKG